MNNEVLGLFLKEAVTDRDKKPTNAALGAWRRHFQFKTDIIWRNVIGLAVLHLQFLYALYIWCIYDVKVTTYVFFTTISVASSFSVTAGAHRLWSHRAYKATWQLRLLLMICNCMVFQNSIYDWVRDHRLHHKHTETDADPHSMSRGFFFAHMGWLMLRRHPDVKLKGNTIDFSDLEADEIIMFQKRNYWWLMPFFTFALPTILAYYVLGETLAVAWYAGIFRYIYIVHVTWSVNSFAHYAGSKTYDKSIAASNNTYVSVLSMGEGAHNYHHVFPWDYKTAELGMYKVNLTCAVIDFFAKIGWAYDLKTVSDAMIKSRAERTGDGLPYKYTKCVLPRDQAKVNAGHHHSHENSIWGWNDNEMDRFDKENALILNKEKSK